MTQRIPEHPLYRLPGGALGAHAYLASLPRKAPASPEDRIKALELERAAADFLSRYAYFFDSKDLDGLMALYGEECILVNTNGTYVGTAAIRGLQEEDTPKTEVSFHRFANILVREDPADGTAWVAAYMYNLAIRDEEPYGTVGTILASLHGEPPELRATSIRITIDSRHTVTPKLVPRGTSGPHAASEASSFDLIGQLPRFPASRVPAGEEA
jgi:hypothetical protein